MFFSWLYALLFAGIIAVNHKYGKPYDEHKETLDRHKARTHARLRKHDEEEREAHEAMRRKRREARRMRREEAERYRERREGERRWVYGVAPRQY
ncbi:hypothetical protein Tdes44962_MAKER09374 [Teratosphaeria destructans]|uniref:Uncharacterized protein n=1 Tax=Teratosphaeria destructans TaxID=418781 RepID=A0A9W7STQ0_9PEZI|nr:hypothetical protein Tdes44962_MAKER09374 [Teratosphaeria destructans]